MKRYDRETKKYVEETEIERKQRKRKTCKGGRPHDFVLVLPSHITYTEEYKFNPEVYYESEEKVRAFLEAEEQALKEKGIINRYRNWRGSRLRHFACTVCGKRDYEETETPQL